MCPVQGRTRTPARGSGVGVLDQCYCHGRYDWKSRGSSTEDRKSTRLNSSHLVISYAVFCLKKKILRPNLQLNPALIPPRNNPPPPAAFGGLIAYDVWR